MVFRMPPRGHVLNDVNALIWQPHFWEIAQIYFSFMDVMLADEDAGN